MGLFDKLKRGLAAVGGAISRGVEKTKRALRTDIRDLFKKGRLVDETLLDELLEVLMKADIGYAAAQEVVDEVRTQFRGRVVQMEDVLGTIRQKFESLMSQEQVPLRQAPQPPTVIMVVGVNGSGKTTSIAKLAHALVCEGKKVILGAADTFRAAAIEQLTIWAQRLGVEIITGEHGSDPGAVAYRAVDTAINGGYDVCIVDTAGRLQTQTSLMQELTKIRRVISKRLPDAPHETLLVLDATTGQPGISQAKGFTEAVQCTGIILAKLDGTAKGGVVIPIRQQVGIPVKFIGVGEKLEDLEPFDSHRFTEALFTEEQPAERT
jgi:fused signal recognition particle receptor